MENYLGDKLLSPKVKLDISNGMLVDTEAEEIPAEWIDDAVIICPIPVKVNAPEMAKAGESFVATIDVDNIAEFNSGQFDLSFDSSVVNVTDVTNGRLDGATAMVDRWEFVDNDTVRVILDIPGITGISGSGYLTKISFDVIGKGGDRGVLDISNGLLVDTEAKEILTEWIDDEIVVGPVVVQVNAPERVKAGESFVATIDVDSIADLNIAQFDLSFDPSVVNVTDVANGSLDGEEIPVDMWDFVDDGTIRVISELPEDKGVSGSGCLAKISFKVAGERGDRSVLDISNGLLVNKEAREIPAEWIDDEIVVGHVMVEVNAPEMVKAGESFVATIDLDDITAFNSGQFDLSFDLSVVNVTGVANGSIDGEEIPVDSWEFVDEATIRVILDVPGITGVSGSGNLAKISFEVVGKGGDRSVLDISEGMLVSKEAREIEAEWIGDEIVVGPVVVQVNAPEMAKVEESFVATIDVDDIADFNMAQFDLSFDRSVVNVTDVTNGSLDGEEIPVDMWDFVDDDTIRVIAELPEDEGVSGSGCLAEISFEVVGKGGDRSVLGISNGKLANKEAEEIPADWIDDEIVVGPVVVEVNAPEMAKPGTSFVATIDVGDIAGFNIAQFDLSFDSSVVNVTEVGNGQLDGEEIPIDMWDFVHNGTIRVIAELPEDEGVSGSGCLAEISFEVIGKGGARSALEISNGKLADKEAREIAAEWIDDEIVVGPVVVEVNAPAMVKAGESFVATIDVDDIAGFNTAQFDLSFDSSVVQVTEVADGQLNGEEIPIDMWDFVDDGTIRVIAELPEDKGVSGSGNLAKISFEVVGKGGGDWSVLDISNGKLVNKEAGEIPAEWIDDEIVVGPVLVIVNAPDKVKAGESFVATIDVDDIADFNIAQFDLSFDSSVVNVIDVKEGKIDGEEIPIDMWDFVDDDTIRVISELPEDKGVSGSGNLAEISFEVVGKGGDRSVLDISNGKLVNKKAREIPAEWIDDVVTVEIEIEKPSVTIETDKSVYKSGEKQILTLTIENPTSKPVQVKVGMSLHVYETGSDVDVFEMGLLGLPAKFEKSFELQAKGLKLPEGKYAWRAYLKDAKGVKISESEAKFSIVAIESSIGAVPSPGPSPGDAIFEDLSESMKRAVNAELF